MAAAPSPSTQLPGDPNNLTAEEQKERRDLIIAVTTAVTVAVAENWVVQKQAEVFKAVGMTRKFLQNTLVNFYVALAATSYLLMREMAKIEINTSDPTPPDGSFIQEITALETIYEQAFASNGARRILDNLHQTIEKEMEQAARNGVDPFSLDDAARERVREKVRALVSRERDYYEMRQGAMKQRIERRAEEYGIKIISPNGAFWLLDITKKTHTADCLAMAGKTWSWKVLAVIRPSNRHYGCGCRLIPQDTAIASGYAGADRVHTKIPRGAIEATNPDAD